jgi:hypothetical protein
MPTKIQVANLRPGRHVLLTRNEAKKGHETQTTEAKVERNAPIKTPPDG